MRGRLVKPLRQPALDDVGTLWTMHRSEHAARCALMTGGGAWTIRVLVDGRLLLEESYERADDAFTTGARWRHRMIAQGWQQLRPGSRVGLDPQFRPSVLRSR